MPTTEITDAQQAERLRRIPIREDLLVQINQERWRQITKWGLQSIPNVAAGLETLRGDTIAYAYLLPAENTAKTVCQAAFKSGEGAWLDVLVEEVAEAAEACSTSAPDGALQTELIQVAAVCLAWLEDIAVKQEAQ